MKSMIGHAMASAGTAGLIKTALALYHGILPPTLHCEEPHPLLGDTRFMTRREAESWHGERRAGVSSFGFGGTDAHAVLDAHPVANRAQVRVGIELAPAATVALYAADSPAQLLAVLAGTAASRPHGRCRLAVFDPTPERLTLAKEIVTRERPWRGRQDIWFTPSGVLVGGGKIAFLFPGLEANFEPRIDDVAAHFGFDAARPEHPQERIETHGWGVFSTGRLLDTALRHVGIVPDAIAGHSVGEWNALTASAMMPPGAFDLLWSEARTGTLPVPDVVYLVVGADAGQIREALADTGIVISHDNCPHQSIICGTEAAIDEIAPRLAERGWLCQKLPFRSGFHTPAFAPYMETPLALIESAPVTAATIPLWSATTCAPYPDEPDAIRALMRRHFIEPVRFREMIHALYASGVRAFVQVGTGSLVGFVDDTLRGQAYFAESANAPQRTGLEQLRRLAVALYVEGSDAIALEKLPGKLERHVGNKRDQSIALQLSVPLVTLHESPIVAPQRFSLPSVEGVPPTLLHEFDVTLNEIMTAREQVIRAWKDQQPASAPKPAPRARQHRERRTFSLSTEPYLIDHNYIRQPLNWPDPRDIHPIIPAMMYVELMCETAERLVPGQRAIVVENFQVRRPCVVAPPVEVEISADYDGTDCVNVAIGDYASSTVRVAPDYPDAPAACDTPLVNVRSAPVDAERIYVDRWMPHGPKYQALRRVERFGDNGLQGSVVQLDGRSSLLDAAGQLWGYWLMMTDEKTRVALPGSAGRFSFYGPPPALGDEYSCTVWKREQGERIGIC
ncbi:MAG TPA: acyltransferase domain-containing protein, partial [Burkholderiaceae bacterium]|nr:acyltransferase domain-containing protein [Burkholderiaceae bacterium]